MKTLPLHGRFDHMVFNGLQWQSTMHPMLLENFIMENTAVIKTDSSQKQNVRSTTH